MTEKRLALGKKGEEFAASFLKKEGYKIIEMNYRSPLGEIDIIAKESKTLVFVEVKTRRGISFGFPVESITKRKQAQIIKSAEYYLSEKKMRKMAARIDVVSVLESTGQMKAELIKNAVEVS